MPRFSSSAAIVSLYARVLFASASFWRLFACVSANFFFASVTLSSCVMSPLVTDDTFKDTFCVGVSSLWSCRAGVITFFAMKTVSNARFRFVSTASAASTDTATRSLASSLSSVSSKVMLSNRFVSSFEACFKRLMTAAVAALSGPPPGREVPSDTCCTSSSWSFFWEVPMSSDSFFSTEENACPFVLEVSSGRRYRTREGRGVVQPGCSLL
mmetsp:Transcript_227/g.724  ORF Transcript_227/g.724 Transcript_227/m.724 type:complete len:212 (-) Transcript_227:12-647(-)